MLVLTSSAPDEVEALRRGDEFFWLDLCDPSPEELQALGERLGLHPLAVEDTVEWRQRPKVDGYDDHLLLVYFTAAIQDGELRPVEVHLYVSGSYVITVRRQPCPPLDDLREKAETSGLRQDVEFTAVYRILDALTDAYAPVIETAEERIDALEAAVLARARDEQLTQIYRLRQDLHALARRVLVQRDAFPTTTDAIMALPGLEQGTSAYLRDIGDHLAQAAGELQRQLGDVTALTDTFFNANANRLNRSAARLSVVGAFFLVWTLVTGFFGQNFGWLVDGIDSRTDFLAYEGASLLLPTAVLAIYFWRRRADWF